MTDAPFDQTVTVLAHELLGIGRGLRVRGSIGIALKGDCRHTDDWARGELGLQIVILCLAWSSGRVASGNYGRQCSHDPDFLERLRTSIESVIIEVPFGRGELPNQFCKIMPIFLITGTTAFGC